MSIYMTTDILNETGAITDTINSNLFITTSLPLPPIAPSHGAVAPSNPAGAAPNPVFIPPNPILTPPNLVWPPEYALRISPRAKRISVQISPKRGLEVVLPKRKRPISPNQIQVVLDEHKTWIKKHLYSWLSEQQRKEQQPILPETLDFPAFNKSIALKYQHTSSLQVRIQSFSASASQSSILLSGAIQNLDLVVRCLKKLLYREATSLLIPWLNTLSCSTGLIHHQTIIRSQSSLWGSCTINKKISLNAKLLFLPKELTEYVLLHELCHTQFMNHSTRFWNLLKKFDPHCLAHRRILRHAHVYLPRWIELL